MARSHESNLLLVMTDSIKNAAKKIIDRLPAMKITLEKFSKQAVFVGVPSDHSQRKEAGENNAALAYIHDNGAPAANIPKRGFMRPGIKASKIRVVKVLGVAAKAAMDQNTEAIEAGLNKAGLIAQNSIRKVINDGVAPALAESTLEARRRRGRTGTKPLIDTAQLRNSISYVIRKK